MKKILLALDPSSHSRRAAEYLAAAVGPLPDCEILLLMVIGRWPATVTEPVGDEPLPEPEEVHGYEDPQKELVQAQVFLSEVSQLLMARGVTESRLNRLIIPQARSIALDVIAVAESEGCDTIVVGRRNFSRLESFFLRSISADMIKHAVNHTVWVVG